MKKILILQLRANDLASDGEYEAFLKFGGIESSQAERVRMDKGMPNINPHDYAAIIVGGGEWNVSDDEQEKSNIQKDSEQKLSALLAKVIEYDIPFLGACYGFGALASKESGAVSKEQYAETPSAIKISLKEAAKSDPLLSGFPEEFFAIVGHKEACQLLPKGAVWLAESGTCPFQMFRLKHNVYATQFHPELDAEGADIRIEVYKHAGYFPPEDAEKLKRALRAHEITIPMQFLKNFINAYCK